jgi:hypothetical protein
MDVCSAFEANEQPPELMQPGEGTFDHPAKATKTGSMWSLATSDLGGDTAPAELAAVAVRVVAAVGE